MSRRPAPTRRWRSAQRVTCSCPELGAPAAAIVVAEGSPPEVQRDGAAVAHACRTAAPLPKAVGRPPEAPAERLQVTVAVQLMEPVHALAAAGSVPLRTSLERVLRAGLATPEISASVAAAQAAAAEPAKKRR